MAPHNFRKMLLYFTMRSYYEDHEKQISTPPRLNDCSSPGDSLLELPLGEFCTSLTGASLVVENFPLKS